MINLDEIFNKLRNGEVLEEIEVDVLEKLFFELEHLYRTEWDLADKALTELVYYKRIATLRKYK